MKKTYCNGRGRLGSIRLFSALFIKLKYCGRFAPLHNSNILFYEISIDLIPRFPSLTHSSQREAQFSILCSKISYWFKHHFLEYLPYFSNIIQSLPGTFTRPGSRLKMSSIEATCKPVLEVDADFMISWFHDSTPDFMRIVFSHPDIVEETTGLWGWIKLNKNWECSSPDLHLSVQEIYPSKVLTMEMLSWYSW